MQEKSASKPFEMKKQQEYSRKFDDRISCCIFFCGHISPAGQASIGITYVHREGNIL